MKYATVCSRNLSKTPRSDEAKVGQAIGESLSLSELKGAIKHHTINCIVVQHVVWNEPGFTISFPFFWKELSVSSRLNQFLVFRGISFSLLQVWQVFPQYVVGMARQIT